MGAASVPPEIWETHDVDKATFPIGARLLLAEDSFIIAMDMEEQFIEAGAASVTVVATVADTLREIEDNRFDAVILDINLSGELALDVARKLVADGTPFVFATGYEHGDWHEEFRNIPLLSKPYACHDVIEVFRTPRIP